MGQYHYTVNLTKKEFIDPYKFGDGLKLVEQCGYSPGGTNDALHLLLAVSNGRGGGDFFIQNPLSEKYIGSWGGDRIAVVGDYAEDSDLSLEHKASTIYNECPGEYKDISDELAPIMEEGYELVYLGKGWKCRYQLSDIIDGYMYSHELNERVISVDNKNYSIKEVITLLHKKFDGKDHPNKIDRIDIHALGATPIPGR